MATTYRVDVYVDTQGGAHLLVRRHHGEVTADVWCPHYVRATGKNKAKRKALAAHRAHCTPR